MLLACAHLARHVGQCMFTRHVGRRMFTRHVGLRIGFASKRDPSKHFFDRGRRRPYLPKAALICLISSCSGKRLLIVNVNFQ